MPNEQQESAKDVSNRCCQNWFQEIFRLQGQSYSKRVLVVCNFIGVVSFVLSQISTGFQDIFILATFIPGLAVAIRRMHDVDKSGWFILIPFYNFFLAVSAGTPGPNRFDQPA